MYQLFVFFMVTDPRTTVSTRRGRMIVVAMSRWSRRSSVLPATHQIALLRPFTCPADSGACDGWSGGVIPGSPEDGTGARFCAMKNARVLTFALIFVILWGFLLWCSIRSLACTWGILRTQQTLLYGGPRTFPVSAVLSSAPDPFS